MSTSVEFLFVVCQVGAESALKAEMAREWPDFHPSFSRPGFVTFKCVGAGRLAGDFDLRSTFARTYGVSLGRVTGHAARDMAEQVRELAEGRHYDHLHAWQRDWLMPGERGFEPGISPLAREVADQIVAECPLPASCETPLPVNRRAHRGQRILDCVIVEPGQWWLGYHEAASVPSRYPGGVCLERARTDVISRAYYKMAEALTWSQLPVELGDTCAEIGSSPGGSCQALLDAGLHVLGIDPADMDERLLGHPRFGHVRKRAADVRRREFRGVRWLTADSNVAPQHTLDSIEAIVTHPDVHVRGMLLTLKLLDWNLAERIAEYLQRVRSWGYEYVRARQLAYNRREICIAAMRSRSMRRSPPWKQRLRKKTSRQDPKKS